MDFICPYKCSYRTNSGYCGSTGGWERCQYRQLHQPNTVVGYVPPLKKTNYDRIVSKSPEELAEWLCDIAGWLQMYEGKMHPILDWLKEEGE